MRNGAAGGPVAIGQFQVGGMPYVTSSAPGELVSGSATEVVFPYVTQWVQVSNDSTSSADVLRVAFSPGGLFDGHYRRIPGGVAEKAIAPLWNLQCASLFFCADESSGGTPQFSVVAGLTQITSSLFLPLTGTGIG